MWGGPGKEPGGGAGRPRGWRSSGLCTKPYISVEFEDSPVTIVLEQLC